MFPQPSQNSPFPGIKIILDYVPNHTSDQHEWFIKSEAKDSEYDNYFIWHDGKPNPDGGQNLPPNNWVSVFYGSAWTWSEKRQQFYFHQFTKQQPDLNYRHPPVVEKMKNVLRFWLEKGVSGFRCDAVGKIEIDYVKWFIQVSFPTPGLLHSPLGESHVWSWRLARRTRRLVG